MTKQKKICIIAVSVLVVCVILLLLFLFRKGRTYPFSYSETSMYVPLAGGELLELTEEGAVYRYGNDGKKTMLLESSDISYISAVYDDGTVYLVNLHEDGTLGLCKCFDFTERKIGSLEGAVKIGLHSEGIVVLTKDGELAEGELPEGWKAFYESEEETVKLVKMDDFSDVTDISTMILRKSICFINDGQVWQKVTLLQICMKSIQKFLQSFPLNRFGMQEILFLPWMKKEGCTSSKWLWMKIIIAL